MKNSSRAKKCGFEKENAVWLLAELSGAAKPKHTNTKHRIKWHFNKELTTNPPADTLDSVPKY